MTAQVLSTPIAWSYSHKLTKISLFLIERNQIITILINLKEFKIYLRFFSKTKCIFKYKCMHVNARGNGEKVVNLAEEIVTYVVNFR